jgi:hypothetical protein
MQIKGDPVVRSSTFCTSGGPGLPRDSQAQTIEPLSQIPAQRAESKAHSANKGLLNSATTHGDVLSGPLPGLHGCRAIVVKRCRLAHCVRALKMVAASMD